MTRFSTWSVTVNGGYSDEFIHNATSEEIAQEMTRRLTDPQFMTEGVCFAVGVQPLPDTPANICFPDEIPKRCPEYYSYMQAAGSSQAMTVEVRVPDGAKGYRHYVVARKPIQHTGAWVSLGWDNGGEAPVTTRVHPEEVFTGEQAASVFREYILDNRIPPAQVLRQIDA